MSELIFWSCGTYLYYILLVCIVLVVDSKIRTNWWWGEVWRPRLLSSHLLAAIYTTYTYQIISYNFCFPGGPPPAPMREWSRSESMVKQSSIVRYKIFYWHEEITTRDDVSVSGVIVVCNFLRNVGLMIPTRYSQSTERGYNDSGKAPKKSSLSTTAAAVHATTDLQIFDDDDTQRRTGRIIHAYRTTWHIHI